MRYYVAAGSGGYQAFNLRGTEWAWLVFALVCSLVSLVTALFLVRKVLEADDGTPKMREIARAIQEGANAYLKRQYKTIGLIVVPVAVLVFVTSTKVVDPATNHTVLGFVPSGIYRTLVFLLGATFSGLAGYIGMSTAVRGNVRTAAAARDGSMPAALRVAIRTGGVTGLVRGGVRPSRRHGDRHVGPAHRDCHSRGIRFRRVSYCLVHACRRRDFHQGRRRRGRPGREDRGGHPRGRPSQCGHDRRQRRGQRGGLCGYGGGPLRILWGDPRRQLDPRELRFLEHPQIACPRDHLSPGRDGDRHSGLDHRHFLHQGDQPGPVGDGPDQ